MEKTTPGFPKSSQATDGPSSPNERNNTDESAYGRAAIIPFACFLVIFATVSLLAIQHKGLTYDEANHLNYGTQLAFGHSSARPINSVMPATALNALGMKIHPSLAGARAVTILFSILTAILVFRWAFELYGLHAAYLAGLLYLFCPNILAHSNLVTTDIYAAGTVLLAMYCFWRLLNRPTMLHAILSGSSLGLALLAKFTAVALGPIFLIIAAARCIHKLSGRPSLSGITRKGIRFVFAISLMAIAAITVINAGNLFQRVFVPLNEFPLQSAVFSSLRDLFPWLGPLPMPIAFAWFQGLDWVLHDSGTGAATPNLYLFGELRDPTRGESFTGYYFLVSIFKVPLAAQLILLATAVRMLWRRHRYDWMRNELFLIVPLIYFFYFFNFSARTQVGLRHFLVAFPLAFVLAGSVLAGYKGRPPGTWQKTLIGLLLLAQAASVAPFYPHFIPYVNEIVTDRKMAYRLFADSNLAWGGDEYYLRRYQDAHPGAIYEPETPATGTIIVGLNRLVGLLEPEKFRWLRESAEPVDTIAGGAYLVYQIPGGNPAIPVENESPTLPLPDPEETKQP